MPTTFFLSIFFLKQVGTVTAFNFLFEKKLFKKNNNIGDCL